MVYKFLFWLYLFNAILIINHEIESAYWKEWELFKLPGGISFFLILHFPILFIILLGLHLVYNKSYGGLIISLILGCGGLFAFGIHTFFIKRGHESFNLPISSFMLRGTLALSIIQIILSLYLLLMI